MDTDLPVEQAVLPSRSSRSLTRNRVHPPSRTRGLMPRGLSANGRDTILSRFSTTFGFGCRRGYKPMTTTTATQSKQLTKKELKKFQELLEEKRKAVLDRARQMLSVENMALDTNDLPDEMDLASSEYLQSFEFRLRGREKSLLSKLDLALKKKIGRASCRDRE